MNDYAAATLQPRSTAPESGRICDLVDQAAKAAEELGKEIDLLRQRLMPILGNKPVAARGEALKSPADCELASRLVALRETITERLAEVNLLRNLIQL